MAQKVVNKATKWQIGMKDGPRISNREIACRLLNSEN